MRISETKQVHRRTSRPATADHSQHPIIGVGLLAAVLWLAYLLSGSPEIIVSCCKLLGGN